jgi:hypothetical protein
MPTPPPPRVARLVLVRPSGELLGVLPAFDVPIPWWQQAEPVVRGARSAFGIDVTVLRLLEADVPVPHGGTVTYLAETLDPPPATLRPWTGVLSDHPLRLPWARPGGPDADLAWADARLRDAGLERAGPAEQVRSWNLSSLWRLPLREQTAWLKHVPPFMAHEGAILTRLAGGAVPRLLAHESGRILMPEIPGEDLYDAELPALEQMVDLLVGLQRDWTGRLGELLAIGLPDWRGPALSAAIADTVERTPEVAPADRAVLDDFAASLPDRFERLAATGIPDTLVHGDFHPGNARGDDTTIVLLDWGDCGVGHPLLDQPAFLDRIPPAAVDPVRSAWNEAWRAAIPNSDPARAAALLAPVAAARQAVIYRRFLDGIEPAEHPYHAADPADWLGRTADLLRAPSTVR